MNEQQRRTALADAFESLIATTYECERNWQLDDLIALAVRRMGR